jgi:glycosyltransferase involved in cell wall biosynthesis
MKKTQFSVIIPALNEEKFLPNLLSSLAVQTNKHFEVIVADGHSQDKTVEQAKMFSSRVPSLCIVTCPKASLPMQRNMGAARAKGEWLVFIDADSVVMPYFIDRMTHYIEVMKPSVFTTWAAPDSDLSPDAIFTLFANVYIEAIMQFKRPLTPGPLSVIRSDIFQKIGGYDESHAFHEDVEIGLRIAKMGIPVSILREALYIWSMRRLRREGKIKVIQQYALTLLPVFFKRPMKHMPGYVMGGQLYGKKKKINRSMLRVYERKLKQLFKELFI